MKRLFIFILIFITIKMTSMAANADSALVEHTSLWQSTQIEAMRNPALHGSGYETSLSQLSLGIDIQRQSLAFVPEKGTGYTLPYIKVNTYRPLNERSTVWGEASYTTGRQHDIKWNSTSDYDLMQPYILADTLGGDTRRERYAISGGYAIKLGRWAVGAEILVRAEQEYRSHDPRMKGVVTDLTFRLGGGYVLNHYRMGASIAGNIYKQTNSVMFYREEGVIPEYQMTGLGTLYSRFSGDKRSLYYDGGGVALMLHASPIGRSGVIADAQVSHHRYRRKLAEFNSMPLTDLYNQQASATVGWKRQARQRVAVLGHIDYSSRTGNEHIGGTSDARYFPVIACLTMYKSRRLDTHASALYGKGKWHLALTAGYMSQSEKYVYPHRQMDQSHVYGGVQGQCYVRPASKWLLTLEASAFHYAHSSDKLQMPFANMDSAIVSLIEHKHKFANANYTDLAANVRADYALGHSRYGLYVTAGGGMTWCSLGEQQTTIHSSIGITF